MQTPNNTITTSNPPANTVASSSTALSSDARLLLQFVARVQSSGLCDYPPLEAHLHRHAETLRIQAAEAARAEQAARAEMAALADQAARATATASGDAEADAAVDHAALRAQEIKAPAEAQAEQATRPEASPQATAESQTTAARQAAELDRPETAHPADAAVTTGAKAPDRTHQPLDRTRPSQPWAPPSSSPHNGSETPGGSADPDGQQDLAQQDAAAHSGPSLPDRRALQGRQSLQDRLVHSDGPALSLPSASRPGLHSQEGTAQTTSAEARLPSGQGRSPAGPAVEEATAAGHGPSTQHSGADIGEAGAEDKALLEPDPVVAPDPQLDLLLQFRERVQSSGLCDHPELVERLSAHLDHGEMRQGNNRLALERLQQRCHQRLQQALTSLAELADASTHAETAAGAQGTARAAHPHTADHASHATTNATALASLAACLSQLRLLLVDGVDCYGTALEGPQRRMLRRQCERAAREDRQLERLLASGAPATLTLVRLQTLAASLAAALEQWDPDGAGSLLDLPAPLLAAPQKGPAAAVASNAIRRHLLPHHPCWS